MTFFKTPNRPTRNHQKKIEKTFWNLSINLDYIHTSVKVVYIYSIYIVGLQSDHI